MRIKIDGEEFYGVKEAIVAVEKTHYVEGIVTEIGKPFFIRRSGGSLLEDHTAKGVTSRLHTLENNLIEYYWFLVEKEITFQRRESSFKQSPYTSTLAHSEHIKRALMWWIMEDLEKLIWG